MEELKNINDTVLFVLMQNEKARNSDNILYKEVAKLISPKFLDLPFGVAMELMEIYNVPKFESVRRSRQKIQSEYPELQSNRTVRRFRKKRQEKMREWARK